MEQDDGTAVAEFQYWQMADGQLAVSWLFGPKKSHAKAPRRNERKMEEKKMREQPIIFVFVHFPFFFLLHICGFA